jgi:chromosome segregation ATPase
MARTPRGSHEEEPRQDGEVVEIIVEGTEPPDPNERLKHLQHELDEHVHKIDHLSKQRDALQIDINDLQTTVAQAKTTVTNYGAGLKDLQTRLQALQYFYDQKHRMVLAAIGERKAPIDDLIHEFDLELERMQDRLRELQEREHAAKVESDEANRTQTTRQDAYDKTTGSQQRITDSITAMEQLRAQITQADDMTDVASMYFLLLEFHTRLSVTQIVSQHELSMELRQNLEELETAKEIARTKSATLSKLQDEYNTHHTDLQNKRANRLTVLLAEVHKKFSVPAQPSPTAGSAGSSPAAAGPGTAKKP